MCLVLGIRRGKPDKIPPCNRCWCHTHISLAPSPYILHWPSQLQAPSAPCLKAISGHWSLLGPYKGQKRSPQSMTDESGWISTPASLLLGWNNPEMRALHSLWEVPSRTEPQLPMMVICLTPVTGCLLLPAPLPCSYPGTSSNCLPDKFLTLEFLFSGLLPRALKIRQYLRGLIVTRLSHTNGTRMIRKSAGYYGNVYIGVWSSLWNQGNWWY